MALIKLIALFAFFALCNAKCSFKATVNDGVQSKKCPEGYEQLTLDRYRAPCVKFESKPATFAEAKSTCKAQGAQLAAFSDNFQYQTMMADVFFKKESNDGVWLGAQRIARGSNESYFLWFDGQMMNNEPWRMMEARSSRIAYYPGPYGYGMNKWVANAEAYDGDCVQMVGKDESDAGKYRPVVCDSSVKLAFYCQKQTEDVKPEVVIKGGCDFGNGKNFVLYN